MRHRRRSRRLSRNIAERKALLKSLAINIITHQRITTSLVKAKEARRVIEKLITLSKEGTLQARRRAYKILDDRDKVKVLFTEIAPLFKNRVGGYTRIIRTAPRRGDNAPMVLLELTERPVVEVKKGKAKKVSEKEEPKKQKTKAKPVKPAKPEAKPAEKPVKTKEPETKVAPPPAHEKKAQEPRKEEKPTKDAPKKGFFKNLRQHFKRKSMD